MPSANTRVTTDHEEIRRWAEARGGRPVHVKGTGSKDDPGILRIDFPDDPPDESLEEISWDEWFEKFDERSLAFLYQENTADGKPSYFNKIVSRETAQEMLRTREHRPQRRGSERRAA
jgi:hypothetical protein